MWNARSTRLNTDTIDERTPVDRLAKGPGFGHGGIRRVSGISRSRATAAIALRPIASEADGSGDSASQRSEAEVPLAVPK